MSSTSQSTPTADTKIEQFLSNNPGWHEVKPIARATGYSDGHTRQTATELARQRSNPVRRRKNHRKPIIAYVVNGSVEVPGSNRQRYIQLIRQHANGPPGNLTSMSLSELQQALYRIATARTVIEWKVEFMVP